MGTDKHSHHLVGSKVVVRVWHPVSGIPACGRLSQEDQQDFTASIGSIVRSCLQNRNLTADRKSRTKRNAEGSASAEPI